jgi:hypothetical protein
MTYQADRSSSFPSGRQNEKLLEEDEEIFEESIEVEESSGPMPQGHLSVSAA